MIRTLSATMIAVLFAVVPALAQNGQGGQGGGGGLRQACAADFQQYCSDVTTGGGARFKCLQDHSDKLSEGCKAAMSALQAQRAGQGGGTPNSPPVSGDQK